MSSHCRVAKACLFGGTLLAAGLAHADGVTLVPAPAGYFGQGAGIFGYARAYVRIGEFPPSSQVETDGDGSGLGVAAASSFAGVIAYAAAQTSTSMMGVNSSLTGPLNGQFPVGGGTAVQFFEVSSALTARLAWDVRVLSAHTEIGTLDFRIVEWLPDTSSWSLTQILAFDNSVGSMPIEFEPDTTYGVWMRLQTNSRNPDTTNTMGELDFVVIPLPSAAALALAGLTAISIRRRR